MYRGTDVPDAHTAVVHLATPYAAFLEVLAQGFLGIQSPAALRRPRDENCESPVGSGPFKVVRWDRQSQVVLERNPDYHWAPPTAAHQGPAYLERIVWKFIQEPSVRFASLQAGEVFCTAKAGAPGSWMTPSAAPSVSPAPPSVSTTCTTLPDTVAPENAAQALLVMHLTKVDGVRPAGSVNVTVVVKPGVSPLMSSA